MPFLYSSKGDILKAGWVWIWTTHTWTCYMAVKKSCGNAGACCERLDAFREQGKTDPWIYESNRYQQITHSGFSVFVLVLNGFWFTNDSIDTNIANLKVQPLPRTVFSSRKAGEQTCIQSRSLLFHFKAKVAHAGACLFVRFYCCNLWSGLKNKTRSQSDCQFCDTDFYRYRWPEWWEIFKTAYSYAQHSWDALLAHLVMA